MSKEEQPSRLAVAKTHKLFIGGKFPRSESGRSYPVYDSAGNFVANVTHASRKDVRDAVVAAEKALPGWSQATAYNRGQVLYRVAEILEGRREQCIDHVIAAEGWTRTQAESIVDTTIDRWVWYAGWSDKLTTVLGGTNPVAGPYFSFTVTETSGVAGILAPQESSLLGLVSVLAPAIVSGGTAVVVSSASKPIPAVTLSEILATADIPAGVVNILTGNAEELGTWLASHSGVHALDLTGATPSSRVELAREAANTVKRVLPIPEAKPDWLDSPTIRRLRHYVEPKTVWHPMGL